MQDETESGWYPGITEKHFEHAIQNAVRTERVACELRCAKTEVLLPDALRYQFLRNAELGHPVWSGWVLAHTATDIDIVVDKAIKDYA